MSVLAEFMKRGRTSVALADKDKVIGLDDPEASFLFLDIGAGESWSATRYVQLVPKNGVHWIPRNLGDKTLVVRGSPSDPGVEVPPGKARWVAGDGSTLQLVPIDTAKFVTDVKDYGAVGDGVADDSTAIQAALNAAAAASLLLAQDCMLLIPPGVYRLGSNVVLSGSSNLTISAYGAKFTLSTGVTFGLRISGTNNALRVRGLHVVGDGVTDSTGIGTSTPAPAANGTVIDVVDCEVSAVQRGILFDVTTRGDWKKIRIENCYVHGVGYGASGGTSGHGYGIALSGAWDSEIVSNRVESCARHSIYISACKKVSASKNKVFSSRAQDLTINDQFGGIEIARSSHVDVEGNTLDGCFHGAVSIEPDESDTGNTCFDIKVRGNTFLNSRDQDVIVGGPSAGIGVSLLRDIIIVDNAIVRAPSYSAVIDSFTQPAVSGIVSVHVSGGTAWMVGGANQAVTVEGGGNYTVLSVTDGSHAVLTNIGGAGNAAPSSTVPSGGSVFLTSLPYATPGVESIRIRHGRNVQVRHNSFAADNAYKFVWSLFVIGESAGAADSLLDSIHVSHNTGTVSAGSGGAAFVVLFNNDPCNTPSLHKIHNNDGITFASGTCISVVFNTTKTSSTIVVEKNDSLVKTIAYSGTLDYDPTRGGEHFVVTATDNGNVTINKPGTANNTNAMHEGFEWTLEIVNSSGGGLGTWTPDAAYKMAGAIVLPANGKRRLYTFKQSGGNYVEKSRSAADI